VPAVAVALQPPLPGAVLLPYRNEGDVVKALHVAILLTETDW
jgi:hypothetical protein